MRKYYKSLLQDFLAEKIRQYRAEHSMTQEQMAEMLRISPRSYIDLEHKRYGCSATTAFFFLIRLDVETLLRLLDDFRELVERADRHDVA